MRFSILISAILAAVAIATPVSKSSPEEGGLLAIRAEDDCPSNPVPNPACPSGLFQVRLFTTEHFQPKVLSGVTVNTSILPVLWPLHRMWTEVRLRALIETSDKWNG